MRRGGARAPPRRPRGGASALEATCVGAGWRGWWSGRSPVAGGQPLRRTPPREGAAGVGARRGAAFAPPPRKTRLAATLTKAHPRCCTRPVASRCATLPTKSYIPRTPANIPPTNHGAPSASTRPSRRTSPHSAHPHALALAWQPSESVRASGVGGVRAARAAGGTPLPFPDAGGCCAAAGAPHMTRASASPSLPPLRLYHTHPHKRLPARCGPCHSRAC